MNSGRERKLGKRERQARAWACRLRLSCSLGFVALLACGPEPDRTPPYVVSTYPQSGDVGVPTNAPVFVAFSEPMDRSSTEDAFELAPATPGSLVWGRNSVSFQPSSELKSERDYVLTLDRSAQDLAGNRLESTCTVTFRTGDSAVALINLAMLGRSVMSGWFEHWEPDPWQPYTRGRFTLQYHEISSPPEIIGSVGAVVDSIALGQNPVVFFKLCFADFEGGDSASAQANLDRNTDYARQVYDLVVQQRGLRLILGNALPNTAQNTDPWSVWNQLQYNQWLAQFAAQHSSTVTLFDFYSVLATPSGTVKPEYAVSAHDAHLNDAGYAALDERFFEFLEERY